MRMKKHKRKAPAISDLPADACPVCGTRMRERRARLIFVAWHAAIGQCRKLGASTIQVAVDQRQFRGRGCVV